MKQLRRLVNCTLVKATRAKQDNGSVMNTYETVRDIKIIKHDITDKVFSSIYGANIAKMLRISSVRMALETFLASKNNDSNDNISIYFIVIGEKRYKIVSVFENWVDIEFFESVRQPVVPEEPLIEA